MMTRICYLLVLVCSANFLFAQNGSLKGSVRTSDGQPAQFVSIAIKGTSRGATSDTAGKYEISTIKAGHYTLVASFVGLVTKERTIDIIAGQNTIADIMLAEDQQKLGEVMVTSSWNKFAQRKSDYVARMPLKPLENAQVYNTITKELAIEQIATDFKSVLKNAPGVGGYSTQNPLGRSQLMIRGFSQIFTLKNGMQVYSNFSPDPVTIEKADVVKGPSATLFGAAAFGMSYGGFINQQTKKPYEHFGGEVGLSAGSWNLNRLTADINTPLNKDKTILFRFNGAMETENGFKDYGYNRSFAINPSFLFKPTERLTIRAELDVQNNNTSNVATMNPVGANVTAKNWKDLNIPYRSSWIGNDVIVPIKYADLFVSGEYRLSDKWVSQTNYMISSYNSSFDIISLNVITDSTLTRSGSFQTPITNMTNIQQNFIGDFKIGEHRNRLLIGADYLAQQAVKDNYYSNAFIIDTINYRKSTQKYLNADMYASARAKSTPGTGIPLRNDSYTYGVYVSDVFNITDNVLLSAGLRFNSFDAKGGYTVTGIFSGNYLQHNFSPKLGLIYQPLKDRLSVFANYQNGFTNVTGSAFDGTVFKPEQATQWEVGVKSEFTEGISGSVSYYNINVTDKLRTDVVHTGFSIQDANQYSRGVEGDLIFHPVAGLNILAGYGHNSSKYVQSNASIQGKTPANVAGDIANFWASYRIAQGNMKGWGIGFGGNYTSSAFADDANTFTIPAYTLFDASVFYDLAKYRLGLKVNNVGNTQSWNRWGSQALRQVIVNFSYRL